MIGPSRDKPITKTLLIGDFSYISAVLRFGCEHGASDLSDIVMDLHEAALQPSSRRTYKMGQRAYIRFLDTIRGGVRFPFKPRSLQRTELNLAFFMAFLLLQPKIRKALTILGYETHVKYLFRNEGCPEVA